MREAIGLFTLLLSCVPPLACGSRQESRHPQPFEPEPASTETEPVSAKTKPASTETEPASTKTEPASIKTEPVSAKTEGTSSGGDIAAICKDLNHRATQKCSKKIAELYASSCRHYLKTEGHCSKEIFAALDCQYRASEEALCAHEADQKCLQANRELRACQRGIATVEQTTPEDTTVPAGWEQVHDQQLGFAVAMPPGAELDAKSKRRTWHSTENGVAYYVAALEPPAGKLENQVYVRIVVGYVGARCQRKLKLNGELELKGTIVVQYHSACPDGSEWHGMLHFWNGKLVTTGYHAPAGATGVQEPFFYSFQAAK